MYYRDITWVSWHHRSPETQMFVQQLVKAQNKENIKAPFYQPFVRGTLRWFEHSPHIRIVMLKKFHVMKYSWCEMYWNFNTWIELHWLHYAPSIRSISCSLWSLTHWGWVTHICASKITIIGSNNGLSPGRRQAIIWTNAWILLIGPLGTNFSEMLIEIQRFSFKKMHLKMLSAKWQPSCPSHNALSSFHWAMVTFIRELTPLKHWSLSNCKSISWMDLWNMKWVSGSFWEFWSMEMDSA